MQIYTAAFLNPNTSTPKIVPDYPQRSAIYVNDPSPTVLWVWSPNQQVWSQILFGVQQVFSGNGTPASPPLNPTLPALYTDLLTGIEYEWNPNTSVWF